MSVSECVEKLAVLLTDRKLSVVTAESCTGGLIAAAFTARPGASSQFERGFVTYSNVSKTELLGVPGDLIEQYGAVSSEVAEAMVAGALKNSRAQIAIAVTGIAGPDGGSDDKPVGLVYIAVKTPRGNAVREFHFTGDRTAIRMQACEAALALLLSLLSPTS